MLYKIYNKNGLITKPFSLLCYIENLIVACAEDLLQQNDLVGIKGALPNFYFSNCTSRTYLRANLLALL